MRRVVAAAAAVLCCSIVPSLSGAAVSDTALATPAESAPERAAARADDDSDQLTRGVGANEVAVTIDALNSPYIQRRKPITMRATVTNTTDQRWAGMQAYLVLSDTPLTDRDSIEEAAESNPDVPSGNRIVRPFTEIGGLQPGESKEFRVRVPYKRLGLGRNPSSGVYQAGIHVLGTDEDGRDLVADGKTRTFLPYFNDRQANADPVEVSMLWPFTTTVRRAADGTYPDAEQLVEDIERGGRLHRMLRAASLAPDRSITLLLDPALIEALSALAHDSFGPPDSTSASIRPDDVSDGTETQRLADSYLSRLRRLANNQDVWMTPYANPDLDALAQHSPERRADSIYSAAESASRSILDRFGISARVAYMPAGGQVELDSLQWAQSNTDTSDPQASVPAAVLAPEMLNDWSSSDSSLLSLDADGSTIPTMINDQTVMSGGPLPGKTNSTLQIRQRLASEATLRAIERNGDPSTPADVSMVVNPRWNPGSSKVNLFKVLDATWVTPTSPEQQLDSQPEQWQSPIGIPDADENDPIPDQRVDAASNVVRNATNLSALLDDGNLFGNYYGALAAMVVSQDWRSDAADSEEYASEAVDASRAPLEDVSVEGPGFVSFSGNSGRVPITIHNRLDEPITVGVELRAEGGNVSAPNLDPVEIPPGQSPTYTIPADIGEVSNTAFLARLTTPEGTSFGRPARFNVRSSVVGTAIWIGMAVAGVLVVFAVVRRVRRQRTATSDTGEVEP